MKIAKEADILQIHAESSLPVTSSSQMGLQHVTEAKRLIPKPKKGKDIYKEEIV